MRGKFTKNYEHHKRISPKNRLHISLLDTFCLDSTAKPSLKTLHQEGGGRKVRVLKRLAKAIKINMLRSAIFFAARVQFFAARIQTFAARIFRSQNTLQNVPAQSQKSCAIFGNSPAEKEKTSGLIAAVTKKSIIFALQI